MGSRNHKVVQKIIVERLELLTKKFVNALDLSSTDKFEQLFVIRHTSPFRMWQRRLRGYAESAQELPKIASQLLKAHNMDSELPVQVAISVDVFHGDNSRVLNRLLQILS